MDDRDALLAAVLANPADDLPRLVFADYLEEHDECALAEFIRVQCEISTFDSSYFLSYNNANLCSRSAVPLVKKSAELFSKIAMPGIYEACKTHRYFRGSTYTQFRRGFIEHLYCEQVVFLDISAETFSKVPVTHVTLMDRAPGFQIPGLDHFWVVSDDRQRDHWSPWVIPSAICKHLQSPRVGVALGRPVRCSYVKNSDATRALSAACVAYGRAAADLQPLPLPELACESK